MDMMYVAVSKNIDGIVFVIRASRPEEKIYKVLESTYEKIIFALLFIIIFAAAISLLAARKINSPVEALKQGARLFAEGNFKHRLPGYNSEEFDSLSIAMNTMAEQLQSRIDSVTQEKNKLSTVLESMVEGVIAIDCDENIIEMNSTAMGMFNIKIKNPRGFYIRREIRNRQLYDLLNDINSGEECAEKEIVIGKGEELHLLASGTKLLGENGKMHGMLIVLNDITKLSKLENMRKDFVSNVSHELKTPITSVKGYLETLIDGAIDDKENALNFLNIILKHANRLNSIIEDLLSLSRIEEEETAGGITLERTSIKEMLEQSIMVCRSSAGRKNSILILKCDDDLFADITPRLMEQAVVNLIENAVKYSPDNSSVEMRAHFLEEKKGTIIQVKDNGPGIDSKHHARLFERFYRVDKARSRNAGGTGLGLAIVKHIVNINKGNVSVESELGKGSTFSIFLPLSNKAENL